MCFQLFVFFRRQSLDPNKLTQKQGDRSDMQTEPQHYSSVHSLVPTASQELDKPTPDKESGLETPFEHSHQLGLSHGGGGLSHGGGGKLDGILDTDINQRSPIKDELSELLNDSSIERHLSGCIDPVSNSLTVTHVPISTLETELTIQSCPRQSPSQGKLVAQCSRTQNHLTPPPGTLAQPSQPVLSSSPLSFDLDSLALQVRDRISDIFDHPTLLPSNHKVCQSRVSRVQRYESQAGSVFIWRSANKWLVTQTLHRSEDIHGRNSRHRD